MLMVDDPQHLTLLLIVCIVLPVECRQVDLHHHHVLTVHTHTIYIIHWHVPVPWFGCGCTVPVPESCRPQWLIWCLLLSGCAIVDFTISSAFLTRVINLLFKLKLKLQCWMHMMQVMKLSNKLSYGSPNVPNNVIFKLIYTFMVVLLSDALVNLPEIQSSVHLMSFIKLSFFNAGL